MNKAKLNTSAISQVDFLKVLAKEIHYIIKNISYTSKQNEIALIRKSLKLNNIYNLFSYSLNYNNFNDFEKNHKFNDMSKINILSIYHQNDDKKARVKFEEKLIFSLCDFIEDKNKNIPPHFILCFVKTAIHHMQSSLNLTHYPLFGKTHTKYKKSSAIQKEYDISIPRLKFILVKEGILSPDNFPQQLAILNGYCDVRSYEKNGVITFQFLWNWEYIRPLLERKKIKTLDPIKKLGKTRNIYQLESSLSKLAQHLCDILGGHIYDLFDDEFNDGFYTFNLVKLPKEEREAKIHNTFDNHINKALKIDREKTRDIEYVLYELIKKIKKYKS